MTKSIIKQELNKSQLSDNNITNLMNFEEALKKILKEAEKMIDESKECVSTIAFHNCKKSPDDCWYSIKDDVAKQILKDCFGGRFNVQTKEI